MHSTDSQYTVVEICKATTTPGGDMLLPRCFYFRNLRYFERDSTDSFTPMAFKSAQVSARPPKISPPPFSSLSITADACARFTCCASDTLLAVDMLVWCELFVV